MQKILAFFMLCTLCHTVYTADTRNSLIEDALNATQEGATTLKLLANLMKQQEAAIRDASDYRTNPGHSKNNYRRQKKRLRYLNKKCAKLYNFCKKCKNIATDKQKRHPLSRPKHTINCLRDITTVYNQKFPH